MSNLRLIPSLSFCWIYPESCSVTGQTGEKACLSLILPSANHVTRKRITSNGEKQREKAVAKVWMDGSIKDITSDWFPSDQSAGGKLSLFPLFNFFLYESVGRNQRLRWFLALQNRCVKNLATFDTLYRKGTVICMILILHNLHLRKKFIIISPIWRK